MNCKVTHCRYKTFHVTSAHRCGKCKLYGHGVVECENNDKVNTLSLSTKYDRLNPIDYCNIKNCKYKWSHKTESHECKYCNNKKHASINCTLNTKNKINLVIECPVCRKSNKINMETNRVYGLEEKCKACTMNSIEIILPECKHAILCKDCCIIIGKKDILSDKITEQDSMSLYSINESTTIFNNNISVINPYTILSAGMGCELYIRKNAETYQLEEFFMHSDSWGQYGIESDDTPYLEEFIRDYTKV